ncbi:hypothetical protein K3725_21685 (plasmid) [Leisingera sp. S132]|uniref:hypothetical protein n=1 Tax=Leisingera sp. S132 TaxID=2867016 RepID=UPI0021A46FEF|nr:hypothetical protein [Leisingera sp. S132]UWQ81704.1 hypothetical protein K3725_21685 [Leisingera sp. S132]
MSSNTIGPGGSERLQQTSLQPVAPRRRQQQPSIPEQQQKQNAPQEKIESSTSYAAMLKDAQDGGVDEAYAATQRAHSGASKENGEQDNDPSAQKIRRSRTAKPAVAKPQNDPQSSQMLKGLRQKQQAEATTAASGVSRSAAVETAPVGQKHDQLMLASSQMKASEVASHVSLRSFAGLARILSENHWKRSPEADTDLVKLQMRATG